MTSICSEHERRLRPSDCARSAGFGQLLTSYHLCAAWRLCIRHPRLLLQNSSKLAAAPRLHPVVDPAGPGRGPRRLRRSLLHHDKPRYSGRSQFGGIDHLVGFGVGILGRVWGGGCFRPFGLPRSPSFHGRPGQGRATFCRVTGLSKCGDGSELFRHEPSMAGQIGSKAFLDSPTASTAVCGINE